MTNIPIYKIFRASEWQTFQRSGVFSGSHDDIRDGFIHFSSAEHLKGTLDKYFAGEPEIIIARMEAGPLGSTLKWETSRGGAKFPHLYDELSTDAVTQYWLLKPDEEGAYHLPNDI